MTDTLHQEPARDQFKSESPIRAFTDWTVQGRYALGKGFRPSLAHVIPYLNAMEGNEGWQLVQVLESDTQTPSFLFRQSYVTPDDVLIERLRSDDGFKQRVIDHLRGNDPAGDIADAMTVEQGADGWISFKITLDSEKVHHANARWTADIGLLNKAMFGMERKRLRPFLKKEKAHNMVHYWETASVASVLRLIDELDYWDHIALEDFITEDELSKVLGREFMCDDPALLACKTDIPPYYVPNEERFVDDVDPASRDPKIPEGVYWCDYGGNFYACDTLKGMGTDFYRKWASRRAEFPQSAEQALPPGEAISRHPVKATVTIDGINPEHLAATIGMSPPPAEAIGGPWTDHGSDIDIPVDRHEDALRFIADKRGMDADRLVKDFMLYFKDRNQPNQVSHKTFYQQLQFILSDAKPLELKQLIDKFRVANQAPPAKAVIDADDPINPKHYGGTACAEIGEFLSANSYQVLKYNWRLGGKDDPCIEIGKSLWYLEREIALANARPGMLPYDGYSLPDHAFFERRLADQSEHTRIVARALISWNRYGRLGVLESLQKLLRDRLAAHGCSHDRGRGLAV